MKGLLVASLLLAAPFAAAEEALAPVSENGKPVNFRMVRLNAPPHTAVRLTVSLAAKGECFDTSIINWMKDTVEGKRLHTINFDAAETKSAVKKPEGCPRRKVNGGSLHVVELPPEDGGISALITYREGEEVRAVMTPP